MRMGMGMGHETWACRGATAQGAAEAADTRARQVDTPAPQRAPAARNPNPLDLQIIGIEPSVAISTRRAAAAFERTRSASNLHVLIAFRLSRTLQVCSSPSPSRRRAAAASRNYAELSPGARRVVCSK